MLKEAVETKSDQSIYNINDNSENK